MGKKGRDYNKMKPRLPNHNHRESNCIVCRNYINKLDDHRQSITGGDVISKKLLRLSGTSSSNNTRQGKRKFDIPKPRLVRPLNMS